MLLAKSGGASSSAYIEDVFSTWLYTGDGSTQTITNGIDTSTYGGMVWIKDRTTTSGNRLTDTVRGAPYSLVSDSTAASLNLSLGIQSFNTNGFSIGSNVAFNSNLSNLVSWTFRKQPKFFDVVTYTGNGVAGRTVAHNLGSVPGCVIVKRTDAAVGWAVYHRGINGGSNPQQYFLQLNSTSAPTISTATWNNTAPTDTEFTVGINSNVNVSGGTYVAYLFAHNAGGFGLSGTDNVISCGSYTGAGASTTINLGWEPQWVLIKNTAGPFPWWIQDNMRGMTVAGDNGVLYAQAADAEAQRGSHVVPTATGFTFTANEGDLNGSGSTYIYIAIRRGPMKTPTSGTSVFSPITANSPTGTKLTTNFPVDLSITQERTSAGGAYWMDRLRGALSPGLTGNTPYLQSSNTGAETLTTITSGWDNTGLNVAYFGSVSAVWWNFRRAPGFFDEVCWAGNDVAPRNIDHNLTVVPEMMIVKRRSGVGNWVVYHKNLPSALYYLSLNATNAQSTGTNVWRSTAPTATVFTVGSDSWVNTSSDTYVNYLFASCPGVSKVGSYSGTGATQTISCGFAARFVLIKRTDSTGDWYVWDSARGIVSANDPHLSLNTTAAEVTTNDSVDPAATGFTVNQDAATNINVSSGTYIYLAIA